jgi:hypothetical protein
MEIKNLIRKAVHNINIVQHRYFLQKRAMATAENKSDPLTDIIIILHIIFVQYLKIGWSNETYFVV